MSISKKSYTPKPIKNITQEETINNNNKHTFEWLTSDENKIIESDLFKNKIKIWSGIWSPKDCKANPTALFIFGDNNIKKGNKGQACIRQESNSAGIPTKRLPASSKEAYYDDSDYNDNINRINKEISKIILISENYNTIYFPEAGLGTGLAMLPQKAPKTNIYLQQTLKNIFGI
eukprot:c18451_g1_i1.p1 GENE.c18451_g1_i1~~c18451_g1_i1.p1  ORF type:complete len:175 (+),score=58.51 c18451_g1_i1:17-541(+)